MLSFVVCSTIFNSRFLFLSLWQSRYCPNRTTSERHHIADWSTVFDGTGAIHTRHHWACASLRQREGRTKRLGTRKKYTSYFTCYCRSGNRYTGEREPVNICDWDVIVSYGCFIVNIIIMCVCINKNIFKYAMTYIIFPIFFRETPILNIQNKWSYTRCFNTIYSIFSILVDLMFTYVCLNRKSCQTMNITR